LLTADQLVSALPRGGYVLIMRHPESPRGHPEAPLAHPGNLRLERQLDPQACASARAMGAAFRRLRLNLCPLSSAAYRARQPIQLAGLGEPTHAPELDEVQDSSPGGIAASNWLRAQSGRAPPLGTNALLVTHLPNIDAFENIWPALGETLVFLPDYDPGEAGGADCTPRLAAFGGAWR
jgi:phosphohistidine phosphatase SixA